MSFFVSRAITPGGQDCADVFARGDIAVLAVTDGAAADLVLARIRDAVLDVDFDLLKPRAWVTLLGELDRAVARVGESTAVIVVLTAGMTVACSAGDSDAWIVSANDVVRLTKNTPRLGSGRVAPDVTARGELADRLVVASDGLFHHVAADAIIAHLRAAPWSGLADTIVELARLPGGDFADDVAVLVAEK